MKEISQEYQQLKIEERKLWMLCEEFNQALEIRSKYDREEDYLLVANKLKAWDDQDKVVQGLKGNYQKLTSEGRLVREQPSVVIYPTH